MRFISLIAILVVAAAADMGAQVRGAAPATAPRRDTLRTRADTLRADSVAARDSTAPKELLKWDEPDSVMQALMKKEGFSVTRYQGSVVSFDAKTRSLELEGRRAGVSRDQTVLVADSITYNDSTRMVFARAARGDTIVLRDPTQNSADVVALTGMTYNVAARRGTVTDISTSIAETGQNWFIHGKAAAFVSDTTRGRETAFYARNGSITSCDDSIPDYHFEAKEIKMVSKNIMVARPAVLYIGDVPVMWLPFIFQDMRSGRRSGVLTPRFGVSELFRNSPTYRRHAENLGYYFAISDYMDAQVALDWRSGSRPSEGDPGWVRLNGEMQYRWLDRFMSGRLALFRHSQRDGSSNTGVTWSHDQDFSQSSHLHTDINYVTDTHIQRTTTFNPLQVLSTIKSSASYTNKFGPASLSVGGSRSQYPGRDEVQQTFPTVSLSTPVLALGSFLEWTPGFSFSTNQNLNIDQSGEFNYRYLSSGDSIRLKRNTRQTTSSFSTPLKIFGFSWTNTFSLSDNETDAPQTFALVDPNDSSKKSSRVFAKSFNTSVDWQTGFALPSLFHGSLNLAPSVSFQNVDGNNGFWVRSFLSGGKFVHQTKRPTFSLGMSPTLFALFPGFGPVTRFRHSITPTISFQYAPAGTLSTEFLAATNRSRQGFLGALPQNQVSLGLSHVLEAKLKSTDTSATAEPRKVRVLSMNFGSVAYDVERARKTHRSGFVTPNVETSISSDLLPGFSGSVGYSLYQGDVLSDTAVFKPFRETIGASFNVNSQSSIFGVLRRVFGRPVPESHPELDKVSPSSDDAQANRVANTPVAGITSRTTQFGVPPTQGWEASFNYRSSRQRPPTGNGNIIRSDPAELCKNVLNPFAYDQCVQEALLRQSTSSPFANGIGGAPFYVTQPQDNLDSHLTFHLTPKWSGTWSTNYDFQAKKFGSHQVSLQRELHDWRAIFAFTQAPNGNFAFNFFIALTAEPDLKFNYDRQTYRP